MKYQRSNVRRIVFFMTLVFAVFFAAAAVAYGAEPTATGVIKEDGTNIRSSYSTNSDVVTVLNGNTKVTVSKERFTSSSSAAADKKWYYIKKGTTAGWIRGDLITITYQHYDGETTDAVNARKGAGTSFASVGLVDKGSEISVRLKACSSTGALWYKVKYNGYLRYIKGSYIKLTEVKADENTVFDEELSAFPASYHKALNALHEKYPNWHFKAKSVGYTWKKGLDAQCENYASNTIPRSKPDGFKAVAKGTYDFSKHSYLGLDGSSWVAASRSAVAYYMDPRNWLDEINIFMFESLAYDSTSQSEDMVKSILKDTAIAPKYSSSYMKAGKAYDISPVYLAAKSRLELGTYDYMVSGTKFTYNGKTYEGYYNAYNIGASDSASGDAAKKGLVFAASGTSYLRPWTTLDLAIRGGAKYIAEDFVGNQQHTLYYERFNVANGLESIGTHQYMTNTMAAATQANITYWNYEENDMLDTAFTFEIPVFKSMPSTKAAEPGKGNNNNYLDSLKVVAGTTQKKFTTSFSRFSSTYRLKSTTKVKNLKVTAVTNAEDATVTITGHKNLDFGENKIKVTVKAASGVVRNYYIYAVKEEEVVAPVVTITNKAATGKPYLKWEPARNADEYKVYRSTKKDGTYKFLVKTKKCYTTNVGAEVGKKYYYKVKAIGKDDVIGEAVSEVVFRVCDLPQPVTKVSNRASDGKPKVTWEAVEGADQYEVYRSETKNGKYTRVLTTKKTQYIHTKAESGKTYYYKVKAIYEATSSANSAFSAVKYRACDLPQPKVTAQPREKDGKPMLTWETIEGAEKYEIYRKASEETVFKKVYTVTSNKYTNTKAEAGKTYTYKVRAIYPGKAAGNSAFSEEVTVSVE